MKFWRVRITVYIDDDNYERNETCEDVFFENIEEAMAYVIDKGKYVDLRNIEIKQCNTAIWRVKYTLNENGINVE